MNTNSQLKKVFNASYVDIEHDLENNIAIARWKGFLKIDQLGPGVEALLKLIKTNKISRHLSDQRELKVLTKDVQKVLTEQALPALEKEGITKLAVQVSEDVFAKATVETVNATTKLGKMSIKTFNATIEANNWLNE